MAVRLRERQKFGPFAFCRRVGKALLRRADRQHGLGGVQRSEHEGLVRRVGFVRERDVLVKDPVALVRQLPTQLPGALAVPLVGAQEHVVGLLGAHDLQIRALRRGDLGALLQIDRAGGSLRVRQRRAVIRVLRDRRKGNAAADRRFAPARRVLIQHAESRQAFAPIPLRVVRVIRGQRFIRLSRLVEPPVHAQLVRPVESRGLLRVLPRGHGLHRSAGRAGRQLCIRRGDDLPAAHLARQLCHTIAPFIGFLLSL